MANEPNIDITGNVVSDPELKTSKGGVAFTRFTVAVTPRKRVGDTYTDLETLWFRVTAFRKLAENVAQSVAKGNRVTVQGTLQVQTYTNKDGDTGTSLNVRATNVFPSLDFATATIIKNKKQATKPLPPEDDIEPDPDLV